MITLDYDDDDDNTDNGKSITTTNNLSYSGTVSQQTSMLSASFSSSFSIDDSISNGSFLLMTVIAMTEAKGAKMQ